MTSPRHPLHGPLWVVVADQLDYLLWARDRILSAAAHVPSADFLSPETVTTRSLRATIAHQVECEWAWRIRLSEGAFPDGDVLPGDFETLEPLAERWRTEGQALRDWLEQLSDDELGSSPPGAGNTLERWRYLLYVVNHGTQQISEAAVLLTRAGQSPGELGYLEFCSSRDRPSA